MPAVEAREAVEACARAIEALDRHVAALLKDDAALRMRVETIERRPTDDFRSMRRQDRQARRDLRSVAEHIAKYFDAEAQHRCRRRD